MEHPHVAKLQRKPAQEWVTHPEPVLLQQVPHALHTQAHDQAEVAVWGVGADAVHGHDVLMGVHQHQLEAAHAAQGKERGTDTREHTRTHTDLGSLHTRAQFLQYNGKHEPPSSPDNTHAGPSVC